jgi:3-hydroxybutyryl-CoA dehydrogenase
MDTANEPYPILLEKVKKGELGAKTGKGFYEWTPEFTRAWRKKMIKNLVGFIKSQKD